MFLDKHLLSSIHQWDVSTFQRVRHRTISRAFSSTAYWISKLADGWLYPSVPLAAYLSDTPQPERFAAVLLLAFTIERMIYLLAKKGFKRKRPADILPNYRSLIVASDEFSFPSGHTSGAFLLVTVLTLLISPAFAVLYLWSFAVACSRVILGVHFPTDTVIGALLGISCAYTSLSFSSVLS